MATNEPSPAPTNKISRGFSRITQIKMTLPEMLSRKSSAKIIYPDLCAAKIRGQFFARAAGKPVVRLRKSFYGSPDVPCDKVARVKTNFPNINTKFL